MSLSEATRNFLFEGASQTTKERASQAAKGLKAARRTSAKLQQARESGCELFDGPGERLTEASAQR